MVADEIVNKTCELFKKTKVPDYLIKEWTFKWLEYTKDILSRNHEMRRIKTDEELNNYFDNEFSKMTKRDIRYVSGKGDIKDEELKLGRYYNSKLSFTDKSPSDGGIETEGTRYIITIRKAKEGILLPFLSFILSHEVEAHLLRIAKIKGKARFVDSLKHHCLGDYAALFDLINSDIAGKELMIAYSLVLIPLSYCKEFGMDKTSAESMNLLNKLEEKLELNCSPNQKKGEIEYKYHLLDALYIDKT